MKYPNLNKEIPIGLDTETTGLNWPVDWMFGFSIAQQDWSEYYDVRRDPKSIDWLSDQLDGFKAEVIMHHASFDYKMLTSGGVAVPIDNIRDTVIMACIIDEHMRSYQLDDLAWKFLGKKKETEIYKQMAKLFGGLATRNVQINRIKDAPPEVVRPYARGDAELTLELYRLFLNLIHQDGLVPIYEFETGLLPTFIRNSMHGIRVNLAYAEEAADKLTPILKETQDKLNKLAGTEINTNSAPQIKKMFKPEEIGGEWYVGDTKIGCTPKGGPSLGAEYLRAMDDPRAGLIQEVRSLIKTQDTFLRGHILAHSHDGRVYPNINQMKGEDGGTGTGRLSYTNPAMQQIPSRNKAIAAIIKPCFLPDEGQVWVDADKASFEVRVFAHLINNPIVLQVYADNPELDFHQYVAELTGLVRNAEYSGQPNAKQLNLSMIFNSGNGAIAEKMGMSWEWKKFLPKGKLDIEENWVRYKKAGAEAERTIAQYHKRIPGIKELAKKCKQVAERRGWVDTATGRRLRFPHKRKSYSASGLLIQATAADWNKQNWKMIEEELDGVGRLILNTHDSYGMSMPVEWQPHYERVKNRIEGMERSRVPLILELSGVGNNWWLSLQGELNAAA